MTGMNDVQAAQTLLEIATLGQRISGLLLESALSTTLPETDDFMEKQRAFGQAFSDSANRFKAEISVQERLRQICGILSTPTAEYAAVVRRDHPDSPAFPLLEEMSGLLEETLPRL